MAECVKARPTFGQTKVGEALMCLQDSSGEPPSATTENHFCTEERDKAVLTFEVSKGLWYLPLKCKWEVQKGKEIQFEGCVGLSSRGSWVGSQAWCPHFPGTQERERPSQPSPLLLIQVSVGVYPVSC